MPQNKVSKYYEEQSSLWEEMRAEKFREYEKTLTSFISRFFVSGGKTPTPQDFAADLTDLLFSISFLHSTEDELFITYKSQTYYADNFIKKITNRILPVLGFEEPTSHFVREVLFNIKSKTYLIPEQIRMLKRFIITRNYYVFDTMSGEFLKITPYTIHYFIDFFPFLRKNLVVEKFMKKLDEDVGNKKVKNDDDVSELSYSSFSGKDVWDQIISLLPFPIRLPVNYNPEAKAPRFMQFLDEVLDKKYHTALKRYIGYALFPSMPFQEIAILVGEGSNGKTVFLNTLINVFGVDNVANVPLQDFHRRFIPSALEDKLMNIYGDLPSRGISDTGALKMLTGGDRILLERKFGHPYFGYITTKHIFSANLLPETKDKTFAFYRRQLIFQFPNKFEGDNRDPFLLEKLKKEKDGIFNWLLEGYRELMRERDFGYPHSVEEIMDIYDVGSDTLKLFVVQTCEMVEGEIITKDDFYLKYKSFCKEHNLSPRSKEYVGRHLKEYIHGIDDTRKKVNGERKRVWVNLMCDYEIPHEEVEKEQEQEETHSGEENDGFIVVRSLDNFSYVSAGLGKDMVIRKEDVLTLPEEEAKILIKAGKLEAIK